MHTKNIEIGRKSYNSILFNNTQNERYGVYIGTASTGLVRMEWAQARFCQTIPCNWSYNMATIPIPNCTPIGYLVAEAQNAIVKAFLEGNCEWLFLIEEDNVLPPHTFLAMNEYMRRKTVPIISGLYFTKSVPAEPMVYRGRGNSYFSDWKLGDKVWVDAVPTGCVIIHRSIIEVLWNESQEYLAGTNVWTRRVFHTPENVKFDPEKGWNNSSGTSDMEFCSRIIVDNIFEKAGWPSFQKKKYPFMVDTNIFVGHIDKMGINYPMPQDLKQFQPIIKPRRLDVRKRREKAYV